MSKLLNNPFLNLPVAEKYDSYLKLPLVKTIRNQEFSVLNNLFGEYLNPHDKVLEVGAGTGYYSTSIAARVESLVALEPSVAMSVVLKTKVAAESTANIEIINSDFFDFKPQTRFDHIIAIGVLDYIKDWQIFLDRCLEMTKNTVIFTAPQRGLWGNIYGLVSRINKIRIYTYVKAQFQNYFEDDAIRIQETGLKSPLTRGLTLIIAANSRKEG